MDIRNVKRCKQCVMPESVHGITFDEDGICSFCQSYRKQDYLGKEKLDRIISSVKKSSNKYDCLVPLSGGRDSTYILYLAKTEYDLNALAVNYDNEFRTNQAIINMQNACEKLGVDFVSYRSKRDIAHKIVKYDILSSSIEETRLCRACYYGTHAVPYIVAERYQVPLILRGESSFESTLSMQKKVFDGFKKSKYWALLKLNFYKAEYCRLLQRFEFPVPGSSLFRRQKPLYKNKDIMNIRVFDYIPWERKKIKETIMNELGWEKPKDHTSTWRVDCMLHPLMNYYFFKMFGCSKDCFGYCNMINGGQMTREEALRQEEKMATCCTRNIKELLEDDIGLSVKEVRRILSFSNIR